MLASLVVFFHWQMFTLDRTVSWVTVRLPADSDIPSKTEQCGSTLVLRSVQLPQLLIYTLKPIIFQSIIFHVNTDQAESESTASYGCTVFWDFKIHVFCLHYSGYWCKMLSKTLADVFSLMFDVIKFLLLLNGIVTLLAIYPM